MLDPSFTEFLLITIGIIIGGIVVPLMCYYIYLKMRGTSTPEFGTFGIPHIPTLFQLSSLPISDNILVLLVAIVTIGVIVTTYFMITKINVETSDSDYKVEEKYIKQREDIISMYPKLNGNSPVSTLISSLGTSLPTTRIVL